MDISEIRLTNLRKLVDLAGGRPSFAEKMEMAYAQVTNYVGKNPTRKIGDAVARRAETIFNKPHGWLDKLHEVERTKIAQGIGTRIRILRSGKKLSQDQLASILGIEEGIVYRWESEQLEVESEDLERLAELFDVTVSYLSGGNATTQNNNSNGSNIENADVFRRLPVLTWVQAGNWSHSESISLDQVTEFLPAFSNCSPESFYLKVRGISNFPQYQEGDYICVDPSYMVDQLETGEMVVVSCNDEATFKMLVVDENNNRFLKALNENWSTKIIELNEDCILVGVVVDAYRPVRRPRPNVRRI